RRPDYLAARSAFPGLGRAGQARRGLRGAILCRGWFARALGNANRHDRWGLPGGGSFRDEHGGRGRPEANRLAKVVRRPVPPDAEVESEPTLGGRLLRVAVDPGNPGNLLGWFRGPRRVAPWTERGLERRMRPGTIVRLWRITRRMMDPPNRSHHAP